MGCSWSSENFLSNFLIDLVDKAFCWEQTQLQTSPAIKHSQLLCLMCFSNVMLNCYARMLGDSLIFKPGLTDVCIVLQTLLTNRHQHIFSLNTTVLPKLVVKYYKYDRLHICMEDCCFSLKCSRYALSFIVLLASLYCDKLGTTSLKWHFIASDVIQHFNLLSLFISVIRVDMFKKKKKVRNRTPGMKYHRSVRW